MIQKISERPLETSSLVDSCEYSVHTEEDLIMMNRRGVLAGVSTTLLATPLLSSCSWIGPISWIRPTASLIRAVIESLTITEEILELMAVLEDRIPNPWTMFRLANRASKPVRGDAIVKVAEGRLDTGEYRWVAEEFVDAGIKPQHFADYVVDKSIIPGRKGNYGLAVITFLDEKSGGFRVT